MGELLYALADLTVTNEHRRSKDYWIHAVCLTTTDDSFGPTEISYLESRFVSIAIEAGRYEVKNIVQPCIGNVSEETECALEEYIDHAKLLMAAAIGEKVFMPLITPAADPDPEPSEVTPLFCTRKETNATGYRTSDGFVVLKGAMISPKLTASCPEYTKKMREKYAGKIDAGFRTTEDILFSSPSAAANFVEYIAPKWTPWPLKLDSAIGVHWTPSSSQIGQPHRSHWTPRNASYNKVSTRQSD